MFFLAPTLSLGNGLLHIEDIATYKHKKRVGTITNRIPLFSLYNQATNPKP